jgi:PRTRC genetic system protein A
MVITMDNLLQIQFPTVMAPRFSQMQPLTVTGERFIIAGERLLFEVSRPWLHAVRSISEKFERSTPYGAGLEEGITLRCPPVPPELLNQFIDEAYAAFPNETAAWVTWDEATNVFTYWELVIESSSPRHVTFQRPRLKSSEHLVLDIHSHGAFAAFFSAQDDADDKDQLCISAVLSLQNPDKPIFVARLSMMGVYTLIKDFYGTQNKPLFAY